MAVQPLHDESKLLAQVAEGDETAFTAIFYHYYKPLGRFIFNMTQSQQVTEEIVQDAFIKIWLRRRTLNEIEGFGNYIFVICRNGAFAHLKKAAAEKAGLLKVEQYLQQENDYLQLENLSEKYRVMIEESVSRLPLQQKKVYQLSRYDRLKYAEIGAQLGISEVTVKKHIQLAVRFIQKDISARMSFGIIIVLTTPLVLS